MTLLISAVVSYAPAGYGVKYAYGVHGTWQGRWRSVDCRDEIHE